MAEIRANNAIGVSDTNGSSMVRLRGQGPILLHPSSPAHQVDDEYHQCHNQKDMNQPSCNMEAEAKEPENNKYYEDCPKHM